ncbi:MAG: hypothetical protein GXY64_06060 [Bacteroidales bacterium]|nr:hypothetical protein [Bacteroidales bacterium]
MLKTAQNNSETSKYCISGFAKSLATALQRQGLEPAPFSTGHSAGKLVCA